MDTLTHEQGRAYLHIGREQLETGEQAALDAHLAGCVDCRVYAAEVAVRQMNLTRLMQTRWSRHHPSPAINERVQSRLRRKKWGQRFWNLTGSLAATAALAALLVGLGWLVWMDKLTRPVPTGQAAIPTQPGPPPSGRSPAHWSTPAGLATFGDTVKLLGYTLAAETFNPNDVAEITGYWQSRVLSPTYHIFVFALDANAAPVAQVDLPLLNDTCRPASQRSGEMLAGCYPFPLSLPAGRYQLALGVYDPASGAHLNTASGEMMVILTTIEVRETQPRSNEAHPVNILLGDSVALLSYRLAASHLGPGEVIDLALSWGVEAPTSVDYTVSIHLLDAQDKLVAQVEATPVNGTRPTSTWRPGEVIADPYLFKLPDSLPPGEYHLMLGLDDPVSGARQFTTLETPITIEVK